MEGWWVVWGGVRWGEEQHNDGAGPTWIWAQRPGAKQSVEATAPNHCDFLLSQINFWGAYRRPRKEKWEKRQLQNSFTWSLFKNVFFFSWWPRSLSLRAVFTSPTARCFPISHFHFPSSHPTVYVTRFRITVVLFRHTSSQSQDNHMSPFRLIIPNRMGPPIVSKFL